MALAVEWLPEVWPVGIPNLKQLLVVAPLTTSILLLFGCRNRNLRTVWPTTGRVAAPGPLYAAPCNMLRSDLKRFGGSKMEYWEFL